MFQEVGIFNAKARLSELLRAVRDEGQCYTITVRGESVADLVPSEAMRQRDTKVAIAAMRTFKKIRGVSAEEIDDWIGEGRR
ncbi:MAG: type II toxin-antitoxin system prevent-host-death family antitoxin [Zoogloeaceae bacterium]|jgi:prevent-host-death family protein|nr:type II toxin-antitoxin system prevent-host-death family antitoxin [Zoogloeaceae bacterium]